MSTVMTKSDYGRATDEIYGLIAWIALGIFLIVVGLLVYALVRYRFRGQALVGVGGAPEPVPGVGVMVARAAVLRVAGVLVRRGAAGHRRQNGERGVSAWPMTLRTWMP